MCVRVRALKVLLQYLALIAILIDAHQVDLSTLGQCPSHRDIDVATNSSMQAGGTCSLWKCQVLEHVQLYVVYVALVYLIYGFPINDTLDIEHEHTL